MNIREVETDVALVTAVASASVLIIGACFAGLRSVLRTIQHSNERSGTVEVEIVDPAAPSSSPPTVQETDQAPDMGAILKVIEFGFKLFGVSTTAPPPSAPVTQRQLRGNGNGNSPHRMSLTQPIPVISTNVSNSSTTTDPELDRPPSPPPSPTASDAALMCNETLDPVCPMIAGPNEMISSSAQRTVALLLKADMYAPVLPSAYTGNRGSHGRVGVRSSSSTGVRGVFRITPKNDRCKPYEVRMPRNFKGKNYVGRFWTIPEAAAIAIPIYKAYDATLTASNGGPPTPPCSPPGSPAPSATPLTYEDLDLEEGDVTALEAFLEARDDARAEQVATRRNASAPPPVEGPTWTLDDAMEALGSVLELHDTQRELFDHGMIFPYFDNDEEYEKDWYSARPATIISETFKNLGRPYWWRSDHRFLREDPPTWAYSGELCDANGIPINNSNHHVVTRSGYRVTNPANANGQGVVTADYKAYNASLQGWADDKKKPLLERVVCEDGFKMSVQASCYHYCDPRDNTGPYVEVEVGFPSCEEELLTPFAEGDDDPVNAVYAYVPASVLIDVLKKHGGAEDMTNVPPLVVANHQTFDTAKLGGVAADCRQN